MKNLNHYHSLAGMFSYPSEDLVLYIAEWKRIILKYGTDLNIYLDPFIDHIQKNARKKLEEYYVSTFYVQPVCCLDIGYVLFGEDSRRGQFMAHLAREHRMAGNDCCAELPDHLPVLLTLLPKLKDEEFANELVCSLIIPALDEMIECFRNDDNLYKGLLRLIRKVLGKDFPETGYEQFRVNRRVSEQVNAQLKK
ncbi:MAG TPA: hypothetical protein VK213_08270 [Bacteroidales bacterium]|nr:hypothetical protein [Bacteroidales bacterium]